MRRFLRRWLSLGVLIFVLAVLGANRWVINSTDSYIYKDWALLPFNEVGVVLGTSKYLQSGKPSPEFRWRVAAAAELYKNGKVKHLIVSGANPDETYNEPRQMYRELVAQGVPASAITMDFAGFRTFDSVVRARAVFGLDRFTVITQKYHSYRAVFIGRKMNLNVVAYLAPATSDGGPGNRHPLREIFARTKAVLDIFLLRTEPRFLGDPQPIQLAPEAEPA
ncbi:SanA/YdcF family protein [Sinimarinibacterium thermocellulolyticum]|uniref:ElyC/SanA/YdcF family protein n=1 Tax=Sinimarinibacterium thermocellulolyticum TaxID=3170016 RepID=A0ABV2ABE0_9GAMM